MPSFALAVAIVLLDQLSKTLAATGLIRAPFIEPGLNQDLALGIVGDSTAVEVTLAVAGIVAVWLRTRRLRSEPIGRIAVALFMGGCVGNAVDRIALGGVRDFIVGPGIVYNLADVALLVGALLLLVRWAGRPTGVAPA